MNRTLEFWFDLGSNYSYVAAERIEELASARGMDVLWKPFMLAPIFKSFGWDSSPFVLQKAKGAYTWLDMERQCKKYGVAWKKPTVFPRAAVYPMRVAVAHEGAAWVPEFCRQMFRANFALDREINSNDFVIETLNSLGLDGIRLVNEAQTEEKKQLLRAQSDEAAQRGIFGAPTFFARGEMFWGNDRLEDALSFLEE